MKVLGSILGIAIVMSLASCSQKSYTAFGHKSLPKTHELKSFAFAKDGISPQNDRWESTEKSIFKELRRRNYFYDTENPEVLVFVTEFPKGVELLTGNTYQTTDGKRLLEPTKVKTRGNTLFIQMMDTKANSIFWRGFSYASSNNILQGARPLITNSILNQ